MTHVDGRVLKVHNSFTDWLLNHNELRPTVTTTIFTFQDSTPLGINLQHSWFVGNMDESSRLEAITFACS